MNIDEAIQAMIDSADYEVVYIGEQFGWHKDDYIRDLMQLGFDRPEAEKGLIRYCRAMTAKANRGDEVSFPDYREDLVARIAKYCKSGSCKAA